MVLLPLIEEIFKMTFKQTPHYNKLRFTLARILLERNVSPDTVFEWTRFIPVKHLTES